MAKARIRVSHPFALLKKGWKGTFFFVAGLSMQVLAAHADTCVFNGIQHSGVLRYPMMGQAARVSGDVAVEASFDSSGFVSSAQVESGPAMLQQAALDYVRSWQVSPSPSVQTCVVKISFAIEGIANCGYTDSIVSMSDVHHFQVTARPVETCDYATSDPVYIRRRFLFLTWKSTPK